MKRKIVLTVTSLVLVSLLSFSNKCGRTCDGQRAYVAAERERVAGAAQEEAIEQHEQSNSPLLRMTITL